MKSERRKHKTSTIISSLIGSIAILTMSHYELDLDLPNIFRNTVTEQSHLLETLPEYTDNPYVILNDNEGDFTEEELAVTEGYEHMTSLDDFGRCGKVIGLLSPSTQPTQKRGKIGMIKPSGWHTVKYNDLIEGNYLYNRCHLIGYQLSGHNATKENLITSTRYLSVTGMLLFENLADD